MFRRPSNRLTAEIFLFGTTFIWASTFVVLKWGLENISPLLLTALRFSLAGGLFILIFPKALLTVSRQELWKGGFLGFLLFMGFAFQTVGLEYTTASKSAFVTGLLVVFTPFIQILVERRMPTAGNIFGVVTAFAGLWLLTAPAGGSFNRGDTLTLLCAVAFSVYIVYLDLASRSLHVLRLTVIQVLSVALFSWFAVWFLETPSIEVNAASIGIVAYLAVAATMLTGYIQTRYQKETTPTRAAVIYTVEPVWAALFAALALGETLGPSGIAGGGLILTGVLISELSDKNGASGSP